MSVFHRKQSSASKALPVLLSSEGPSNVNDDLLAEQAQNQAEEITNRAQGVAKDKKGIIPSKTIDHVRSYPLVQQTRAFLNQIPAARVFIATTKPVVKQVLESKPLQLVLPITNLVDTVAHSSLNLTEKVVPSMKTKTYQRLGEEVLIPYNLTVKYSKTATNRVVSVVEKNVYDPAHEQVLKFRKYYNAKFYDTKGKPLIRSTFDPLSGPLNNAFEHFTVKYFPEGKDVPREGHSSELNRSVALFFNFIGRTTPIVEQKMWNFAMVPCKYAVHVNEVFNKSLDKQPQLTIKYSWIASKDALKQLEKEIALYMKGKSPKKLCRKNKAKSMQETIEGVEAQVQAQVA